MTKEKKTVLLSVFLIIILGIVSYANSLNGKFVWDDRYLIQDNIYIKNPAAIANLFTTDIGTGARMRSDSYRPLQMITYLADYSLWKLDVRGYHVTNVLLHILTALCVFWLIGTLFNDRFVSLLTGILFVTHPVNTEATSYISGRADPLAALFILISAIFYIKSLRSERIVLYILMTLSYTLALLSRESSLMLPVLLVFYQYAFKKKFKLKAFLAVLGISFIYILARIFLLKLALPHDASGAVGLFKRMPGFFVAVTGYTRLLFLPFNLHMEYGNRLFSFTDRRAISGIIILVFSLIYAFRKRKKNTLVFFSVYWFFLAILPQSNLYPIRAYMAEHWLYLPSIGFFALLSGALRYIYERSKNFIKITVLVFIAALVSFYSYLTIRQNASYWREPLAFYERTLVYAPESARVNNDLGVYYIDTAQYKEAMAVLKKAIELDPHNLDAYNNLGYILYSYMNDKEGAVSLFKEVIELNPTYAAAYNNLGNIYVSIKRYEEAVRLLKRAIELNPNYREAYSNLGNAYSYMGRYEEAAALYEKAIQLDPNFAAAYNNLGNVYRTVGRYEKAISALEKAIELDPNNASVYYNLGLVHMDAGNTEKALSLYKRAAEIDPRFSQTLQPHGKK